MTRRQLRDALLLPIALVVVVLEDVVWAGLRALLRQLTRLGPVQNLAARLGRLPGWAALPLFLVPEGFGRVGEFWAFKLLLQGHVIAATATYVGIRLVATLMAVFVYHACEATLLRYRWFAAMEAWVHRVRLWAVAQLVPLREMVLRSLRHGRSRVALRIAVLRRAYSVSRFRGGTR